MILALQLLCIGTYFLLWMALWLFCIDKFAVMSLNGKFNAGVYAFLSFFVLLVIVCINVAIFSAVL